MSAETQTPTDDPQTPDEGEALRELSPVPGADAARISPDLARRMVTEWDRDELRKLTQSLIGRDIFTENEGDPVYFMVDRKGTLVAEKSDFRVERVGPGTPEMAECKRVVVETTHYLHSWPSACEVFRLVPTGSNWATHRKDGTPIIYGVALYGYGAGATVQSTVCGSPDAKGKDGEDYAAHVYELTRLWVAERMAQNCTGMLLSESLGQQSRPIIVTYADSEQHDYRGRFTADLDQILPHLLRRRVHPAQAFAIGPDATLGIPDSQIGFHLEEVLVLKRGKQRVALRPDYVGFEIPDVFVVGYGLDYNDAYRNLPYLAALEPQDIETQRGS